MDREDHCHRVRLRARTPDGTLKRFEIIVTANGSADAKARARQSLWIGRPDDFLVTATVDVEWVRPLHPATIHINEGALTENQIAERMVRRSATMRRNRANKIRRSVLDRLLTLDMETP